MTEGTAHQGAHGKTGRGGWRPSLASLLWMETKSG